MKKMKRAKYFAAMLMLIMVVLMMTACDTKEPVLKGIGKTVEVQCGTEFNLDDYLNEKLKIKDETDDGIKEYNLKDLEYTIKCDEEIYNEETGDVKTGDYGTFDVKLAVKDESRNKATLEFQLFLNPVEVTKGTYTFPDDSAKGKFNVQGYCEIKNTSSQFLKLSDIRMQLIDKDDVVAYETDMPEYSTEYLLPGNSCYVMDELAGWDVEFNHEDDIADIVVDFDYSIDKTENDTTLEVGKMEAKKTDIGYEATATVTNPYDKGVDYYTILAGMYDKDGNLIGVMKSYGDTTSLNPKGKGKAVLGWFAESMAIPDRTKEVRGQARVVTFEGE